MASSKIKNPYAIQRGLVTYIPDKCSGAAISLIKSGNICSLHIGDGFFTASAGESFAVIPEGFRPNETVDYLDSYNKYRVQIFFDGKISCTMGLSNTILRGSVIYITDH